MTSFACTLAVAVIVAAVLVGCGSTSGSSDAGQSGAVSAAVQSPLSAAENGSQTSQHYIVKSLDQISGKKPASVVSYPTGLDTDEVSATGAGPVEPCSLVSRRKAATILGGPVSASQEPQGPTCVYTVRGSARQVTLVVESIRLSSLRKHARKTSRVQVAGHTGWCLRYESTSVVVPLGGGRVLHVTGPCDTAASFAARALPRASR